MKKISIEEYNQVCREQKYIYSCNQKGLFDDKDFNSLLGSNKCCLAYYMIFEDYEVSYQNNRRKELLALIYILPIFLKKQNLELKDIEYIQKFEEPDFLLKFKNNDLIYGIEVIDITCKIHHDNKENRCYSYSYKAIPNLESLERHMNAKKQEKYKIHISKAKELENIKSELHYFLYEENGGHDIDEINKQLIDDKTREFKIDNRYIHFLFVP